MSWPSTTGQIVPTELKKAAAATYTHNGAAVVLVRQLCQIAQRLDEVAVHEAALAVRRVREVRAAVPAGHKLARRHGRGVVAGVHEAVCATASFEASFEKTQRERMHLLLSTIRASPPMYSSHMPTKRGCVA